MAQDPTTTIVGNLTDAPELRYTPQGTAMARFRIACTPRAYDKATGEWRDGEPLFMPCTAWRELAENIAESLTRGARVIVTGRLRQSRWETPDGEKRSMIQLDVDEIGPSLRFATAQIKKLSRSTAAAGAAGAVVDPFTTADPPESGFDDQPPF
jgi:single-strand DNA-binding protein